MDIEEIMTMIIKESEDIPMQLLDILINSVKKENQNVSPRSYVLGEKVLQESAVKLHPYLQVTALDISFNNYSEVVELIWREATKSKPKGKSFRFPSRPPTSRVENAPKELAPHAAPDSERGDAMKLQKSTYSRITSFTIAVEKVEPESTQTLKKRGWKPTFLKKPDEGYDEAWLSGEKRSKAHILFKVHWKNTRKRSRRSSGDKKTPIVTSK